MAASIEDQLADLRARSLLRRLRTFDTPQQPEIEEDGKRLISFASNDYLGLATEPALKEAAKAAIDRYGMGSGASRLVSGSLAPHAQLEDAIAHFKGTEAALAFSSGYATALGTLSALCGEEDVIILDKLSHASLIDGARLSRATVRVFPHNHLGKLESHLEWATANHPDARVVIVTEAVFSMDGDRAPLTEIVALKNEFGAMLLVDEAHALGVLGRNGRGLADALRLEGEVDIQMGTLSKALGTAGGYIAGSRRLIELLVNRARSFVYSTAPPPAVAAAACAAIEFMQSGAGEKRREKLWENLGCFGGEMPHLFSEGRKIQSAIIPLILGDNGRALEAADRLAERGFYVPAIRHPTVPRDGARLRITLSARHTQQQIAALCGVLRSL
jgi:glycine C-acetyltransferase/8-amino-7-oxononanoate synthase